MRAFAALLVVSLAVLGACGGEEQEPLEPVPVAQLPALSETGRALDPAEPLPDDDRCILTWQPLLVSHVAREVWDVARREGVIRQNADTRALEILVALGNCSPSPDGCAVVWHRHSDHLPVALGVVQGGLPIGGAQIGYYRSQLHLTYKGYRLAIDEEGVWAGGAEVEGENLLRRLEGFKLAHPVTEQIWEVGHRAGKAGNPIVRPLPDGTYESTSKSCDLTRSMRDDAEYLLHIRDDVEDRRLDGLRAAHQPLWDGLQSRLAEKAAAGGCRQQLLTLVETYIRFRPYEPFQEAIEAFRGRKLAFNLAVNPERLLADLMEEHRRLWSSLPPDAASTIASIATCPSG